ncbi:hypothetical protein ABZ356_30750 [Micromonospora zamorensis]
MVDVTPSRARPSGRRWRGVGWLVLAGVGIALVVSVARGVLGATVVPG